MIFSGGRERVHWEQMGLFITKKSFHSLDNANDAIVYGVSGKCVFLEKKLEFRVKYVGTYYISLSKGSRVFMKDQTCR